jgi:hypothetical protein
VTEVLPDLRALCERVLRENWREGVRKDGVPFGFSCPSAYHYPWQWYWDSCFHAIAWRRIDPERGRRELTTLLDAGREDGFIGHTTFWNVPLTGRRRVGYNVLAPDDLMTATIQPPLLAWAWRIAVGDPTDEPRVVRHHDWIAEHRDLEGDGLVWILQPDESGLDASPQFDPVWGSHAHGRPGFVLLVRRNRRLGFDIARVRAAGGPVVCDPMTNVLHGLSQLALDRPSITPALIARCYDEEAGLFRLDAQPAVRGRIPVTLAALSPLALPDLPEEIGRRLVEEHLLDEERFWLPVPPPSVDATDPTFSTEDVHLGMRRYWRGPTWINSAWLVWLGLVRLGYAEPAAELARRLAPIVEREGLREYYHPRTGRGMGQPDFGWSALILELTEPDPAAPRSHLRTPPDPAETRSRR